MFKEVALKIRTTIYNIFNVGRQPIDKSSKQCYAYAYTTQMAKFVRVTNYNIATRSKIKLKDLN